MALNRTCNEPITDPMNPPTIHIGRIRLTEVDATSKGKSYVDVT